MVLLEGAAIGAAAAWVAEAFRNQKQQIQELQQVNEALSSEVPALNLRCCTHRNLVIDPCTSLCLQFVYSNKTRSLSRCSLIRVVMTDCDAGGRAYTSLKRFRKDLFSTNLSETRCRTVHCCCCCCCSLRMEEASIART
jgi:hypothetical protein